MKIYRVWDNDKWHDEKAENAVLAARNYMWENIHDSDGGFTEYVDVYDPETNRRFLVEVDCWVEYDPDWNLQFSGHICSESILAEEKYHEPAPNPKRDWLINPSRFNGAIIEKDYSIYSTKE